MPCISLQIKTIKYELPLAIMQLLGVNASDYAMRAEASHSGIDPFTKKGLGDTATMIRFWQRTTREEDKMTPEFGIWLNPGNDFFLLCVYLHRAASDGALPRLRQQFKDSVQVEPEDGEHFDAFARGNEWIPRYVREGEIVAIGAETNYLPGPGELEGVLIKLFKDYCSLVWEVKGVDLLPERFKNPANTDLSPFQTLDILNGRADFFEEDKEKVVSEANHKCEIDESHTSFPVLGGYQYMDVSPIIPFTSGMMYGQAIFSTANAACVCPNCKARIRFGSLEDREDMLIKLYRNHKDRLFEQGIDVTLTQVLSANGL